MADRLLGGHVQIRLAPEVAGTADARLTVLTICNHVLRFASSVVLVGVDNDLLARCQGLAALVGRPCSVRPATAGADDLAPPDAVATVGTRDPGDSSTVVSSEGWLARISTASPVARTLPWSRRQPNATAAIAAGCLASAEIFFRLVGVHRSAGHELSLRTGEVAQIGALDVGPDLGGTRHNLDGLLVGCGGVGTAWAAAVAELPISGRLRAVDRQPVGEENIGPYALAGVDDIGKPKVTVVERALAPHIAVTGHAEELDLFLPRIVTFNTFAMPPVVISGLDDPRPRHTLQRLWPATLVDLAAGGTTAQVHVHRRGQGGQCLLGVHSAPPDAPTYGQRVASATGLRPDRITDAYNQPITAEDVRAAPEDRRDALERARQAGQLICGYITDTNLRGGDDGPSFGAAAPFVAGLAGAMGASVTLQALMGAPPPSGWHWQYSFLSGRSLVLHMQCAPDCACAQRAAS